MATPNRPFREGKSIQFVDGYPANDIEFFTNVDCPHQLGLNECGLCLGHPGLHHAKRVLTDTMDIEVFWADEWNLFTKEAETQVGGSDAEVGLA